MQALQYKQFQYVTRFQHAGISKPDIDGFIGIIRRVQEGEMKEAKGIMDVTFTMWVFIPARGVTVRVRAEGPNAEMAKRRAAKDVTVKFSGFMVPDRIAGWVRGTEFEYPGLSDRLEGTEEPASQKEEDSTR